MVDAAQLVWTAASQPDPCDVLGVPIARAKTAGHCARCGADHADFDFSEVVSSNFLPTRNANRLAAFGGRRYCAACVFAARTLRLRCVAWFASAAGVVFWRTRPETPGGPRPDPLGRLLNPPPPPFVAAIPMYGIAHGGEAHYRRTWWPGETMPDEPLIRLQSKHVAMYARVATSRDRFPVQVDDVRDFVLERDAWLRARTDAEAAMRPLVDDGVPPFRARAALRELTLPGRVSAATARTWPALTAHLRPHVQTVWWPVFCELIPTLDAP